MSIEFFEWFDNLAPMKQVIDHRTTQIDEENCINEFCLKPIEKKKYVKTDTIKVAED